QPENPQAGGVAQLFIEVGDHLEAFGAGQPPQLLFNRLAAVVRQFGFRHDGDPPCRISILFLLYHGQADCTSSFYAISPSVRSRKIQPKTDTIDRTLVTTTSC